MGTPAAFCALLARQSRLQLPLTKYNITVSILDSLDFSNTLVGSQIADIMAYDSNSNTNWIVGGIVSGIVSGIEGKLS